jgi:hypothetical protein
MKAQGHLGRCYLRGRAGDAANVILSAIGYNLLLIGSKVLANAGGLRKQTPGASLS